MNTIEPGAVLDVSKYNLVIDNDYTVIKDGIPIGSLKDNLTHFEISPKPEPKQIDKIVYLAPYVWGFKQFTNIVDEFEKLDWLEKREILQDYVNQLSKLRERD